MCYTAAVAWGDAGTRGRPADAHTAHVVAAADFAATNSAALTEARKRCFRSVPGADLGLNAALALRLG